MCDVIFITPNDRKSLRHESMGTLLLATILKKDGIKSEVYPFGIIGDLNNFDEFLNNTIKIIEEEKPKIVSLYTRCDFYHVNLRLAKLIKEKFKDIYVVFGGPQADITAEKTIKRVPYVDFICCGEGETTISKFFASLLNGKPDLTVDGLVYKNGDEVIKNPRPALIEDLDSLPLIDFSFSKYSEFETDKSFPIEVGRGCPFGCVFCSTKSFWGRRYRLKSSKRIIEEVKRLHENHGIKKFQFNHDMFTANRKNILEICEHLKELGTDIKWSCSARVDCLDPELLDKMVEAGLMGVYMGIETGSPRMQKLINKRLDVKRAAEIIEYMEQKNIRSTASFIFGFPEETEEDLSYTLSFILKLFDYKTVRTQTHLCAFLAETALTQQYKEFLTPTEQYSDITGSSAVEACKDIIEEYPELFDQMMEYKTKLRSKLKHFNTFLDVYGQLKPVYRYIADKYSVERKIEMYFDFVEANKEFLEANEEIVINDLINNDKFYLNFADDEAFDLIKDYYRFRRNSIAQKVLDGGMIIDMYCFNPDSINKYQTINEYPRNLTMVSISKEKWTAAALSQK